MEERQNFIIPKVSKIQPIKKVEKTKLKLPQLHRNVKQIPRENRKAPKVEPQKQRALNNQNNFVSQKISPYDLEHSNAVLRKKFNLEIVMIDPKLPSKNSNLNVYNLKYKVKKCDQQNQRKILEFLNTSNKSKKSYK